MGSFLGDVRDVQLAGLLDGAFRVFVCMGEKKWIINIPIYTFSCLFPSPKKKKKTYKVEWVSSLVHLKTKLGGDGQTFFH